MVTPRALIIRAAGTNTDVETVAACRMAGFETGYFDVHVQPGRTLTIKEDLRESP